MKPKRSMLFPITGWILALALMLSACGAPAPATEAPPAEQTGSFNQSDIFHIYTGWLIAADTRNPDLAHTFINFVLRPAIAAQEARYTRYATGNHAANGLLDEHMRDDPATYPAPELLAKLEYGLPIEADGQNQREEVWREVRL